MARRRHSTSSRNHVPFAVFAILLAMVAGVYLHNRAAGENVLGTSTSNSFLSFSWLTDLLASWGFGGVKPTQPQQNVQYTLPSYSSSSSSGGGFSGLGSPSGSTVNSGSSSSSGDTTALMNDLGTTSDDGGASDFNQLQKDASGL